MSDYNITLACRNNARTEAIIRGTVGLDGVHLDVFESESVPLMVSQMFRGRYDVSEFSLAELAFYTSRHKADFIGIPVFPHRAFRHRSIFCHPRIKSPEWLDGKKIGFPRLIQTACVWQRGMLIKEYGISPKKTQWYMAALHHWDNDGEDDPIKPSDGSVIHWLDRRGKDPDESLGLALVEGKLDAFGTTRDPAPPFLRDKRARRLFDHYTAVETSYYRKTKIFPIMHALVVRKDVVEEHPELPPRLFDLFSRSRKMGKEQPILDIAEWPVDLPEDPWHYGLENNTHEIDEFLSYCHDMGITNRRMKPRELFVPSTWELTEEK